MNALYTFQITDFTNLFKELHTIWANKVHIDASQYFIKLNFVVDDFVYNNELANDGYDIQIGAIIAFDMIPISISQLHPSECMMYSTIAASISSGLLSNYEQYPQITSEEWSIIIKPFIHTNDREKLSIVINKLSDKHQCILGDAMRAFYQINTDVAISEQRLTHKIKINQMNQWKKYSDVLQYIPSDPITYGINNKHFVIRQFRKSLCLAEADIYNKNIIISLSGSVESCVCLYIIKQVLPLHNIVAVYFDTQKQCNTKNLGFIQKLCAVLNVKLYFRKLCKAEQHHTIMYDIRLDMYNKVSDLFESHKESLVIFGNTMDNCFENIIKNISVNGGYKNLSNSDILTNMGGISYFRPLLKTRKSEILVFGISMNIPFMNSSTPYWSRSAKVRDVVLPALQNVNKNIIHSFITLKNYLQSADEIINYFVTASILPKFSQSENKLKVVIETHQMYIFNMTVWCKIFSSQMFTKMFGTQKVSYKTISEFVQCLKRLKRLKKQSKFMLLQDVQVLGTLINNEYIMLEFMSHSKRML
jgi:tRNA(Ile)-lysidine synthase TilS/MesJ